MANTRSSAKRARQEQSRNARNTITRSKTKTALKKALTAIQKKDLNAAKEAYVEAIRAIGKAASKGVMPRTRAARKISRLTIMAKKVLPDALNFKAPK